jgi:lactoylglutathione lyase
VGFTERSAQEALRMKNDHTAFQVSDLDSAVRFYTETLGLRLISRNLDPEHQEAYAFLSLEGGNLELLQKLDRPFRPRDIEPPYCPHLAIGTDDLSQVVRMASEKGIRVAAGPFEIPGEVKWLYVCDPDNNVIEYVEWAAKK